MLDRLPKSMSRRPRVLVAAVAVLALVLAAVLYAVWSRPAPSFERATSLLPKDTLRIAFTDWTGVRAEMDAGAKGCAAWPQCDGVDVLDDSELGSSSVTSSMGPALAKEFGWGPRTLDWEVLGQARDGQVLIADVGSADLGAIAKRYEGHGFKAPKKRSLDGGVWVGGPDVLTTVPGLTDEILGNVAFLADEHLLLTSDDAGELAKAVKSARDGGLAWDLAAAVDAPLSAVGFVDDFACEALSMADADPGAQATAARTVEEAGGVSPLTGYLVALGAGRAWTAAFGFETADQARHDARTRQSLARAEDPGQMESYPDLFTVTSAERDDRVVVLHGTAARSSYALSETTQGPVLLASC
jgi:hypothetical protein